VDPVPVLETERVPRSSRWRQVFEMDETVQAQIARLTSDVQHVQTDVADIKVSVRRVEDRLDAMNGRIDGVNDNIYRVEGKLTDKMEANRSEQAEKTEAVRNDLTEKIDGLRSEISSMKVWALSLYFALAGSLPFVMAKGFKWL
jgi:predicted  nucleic acid-binding Zn-ribbon protein